MHLTSLETIYRIYSSFSKHSLANKCADNLHPNCINLSSENTDRNARVSWHMSIQNSCLSKSHREKHLNQLQRLKWMETYVFRLEEMRKSPEASYILCVIPSEFPVFRHCFHGYGHNMQHHIRQRFHYH